MHAEPTREIEPSGRYNVCMARATSLVLGGVGFCVLVLLNVGGYRYGVSDQAFYVPVVLQRLDPRLFPYDAPLLDAQNQLFAFDNWLAPLLVLTGVSLPIAFLVSYFVGVSVVYAAAVSIGRSLYSTWWGVGAFVAALAIRHRIPDTAVNTFEPYLHPRQLAFAAGLVAAAIFLRGRTWVAFAAVAAAFLLHPTTGFWFAVLIGIAALAADREARPQVLALAGGIAAAGAVLLASTFRDQLVVMDATWSAVLQSKDYLLATQWPLSTWFVNLGFAAIVAGVYDYRRTHGLASARETGLVAGGGTLLLLFLASLPLAHAGVAFVVQLQLNRIFWILDILAIVYTVWVLVESPLARRPLAAIARRRLLAGHAAVALIVVASVARGSYVTFAERAEHPLVEIDLPATEWTEVMRWAGERPIGTHFLADPGHAWRYGSSVRVGSGRDVYLEEVKDIGIAIYSSNVAHRVARRIADLGDFSALDPARARWLARRYDLDYLITERALDLPAAHQHGRFTVYDLRSDNRFAWRADAALEDD